MRPRTERIDPAPRYPGRLLAQFGAQTIPRRIFQALLSVALETSATFAALPESASGDEMLALLAAD